jgi:hypothetical protein
MGVRFISDVLLANRVMWMVARRRAEPLTPRANARPCIYLRRASDTPSKQFVPAIRQRILGITDFERLSKPAVLRAR